MGLSAEELRLLEQMERALVEEDPKFASTLRGTSLRSIARRRAIIAGVAFVIGVAVMMGGAIQQSVVGYVVGIAGFLIMLASATLGLTALRGQHTGGTVSAPSEDSESSLTLLQGGRRERRPRRQQQQRNNNGSFMERMEQRWRKRRERGGF